MYLGKYRHIVYMIYWESLTALIKLQIALHILIYNWMSVGNISYLVFPCWLLIHHTYLPQELLRFNGLTATIKCSLKGVKKAVSGERVMCDKAEKTYQALMIGRLPPSWETRSYPSRKALAPYISDLLHRFVENEFQYLLCRILMCRSAL